MAAAEVETAPERLTVRAVGRGAFSPYAEVRLELKWAGERAMLVSTRRYYGGFGEEEATALLSAAEVDAIAGALWGCGLAGLEPAEAGDDPAGWTYELTWRSESDDGGAVTVRSPETAADHRAARCVAVLRAALEAHVREEGFRWLFVAEEERGYVDLSASPAALVTIDGVPYGEETPLWHVPLAAGRHELLLEVPDQGLARRFELVVEAGVTTVFEVDLRR